MEGPQHTIPANVKPQDNAATNDQTKQVDVVRRGVNATRTYHRVNGAPGQPKTVGKALRVDYVTRRLFPGLGLRLLGAGSTGLAFEARAGHSLGRAAEGFLASASNVVRGVALPLTGVRVVVKVTFRPSGDDMADHIDVALREARVHAALAAKEVTAAGRTIRGRDLVPRMYGAGMDLETGAYVIFMGAAEGRSIDQVLRAQNDVMLPAQFVAVDRAFQNLWMLGFCHADAHGGNIFLSSKGASFIDLGHALALPPPMRARMRTAILGKPELVGFFFGASLFGLVSRTVDAVMKGRGYTDWINSDGKMIRFLLSKVPPGRLADVPRLKMRYFQKNGAPVLKKIANRSS